MRNIYSIIVLALVPCISEAAEYACRSPSGWESVQASSQAEASHTAKQRWSRIGGCALGSPNDAFVTDPTFANRKHLRPFLPPDIRYSDTSGRGNKGESSGSFLCDSTGGFLPDNSTDKGGCSELESASMGKWKMRTSTQQRDHLILWRRSGANWQFWVHLNPSAVIQASPEARDYAQGRGFSVQETSVGSPTSSATPTDVVKEKIQKGVVDLLKGLGSK